MTSFQESSLSTEKTKMKAFEVLIESSRIAGNAKAPDVSKMSRVNELSSGRLYSPRWSSSTVARYLLENFSYRNWETICVLPTQAEPITTTRCLPRKTLRDSLLAAKAPVVDVVDGRDACDKVTWWVGDRSFDLSGKIRIEVMVKSGIFKVLEHVRVDDIVAGVYQFFFLFIQEMTRFILLASIRNRDVISEQPKGPK